MSRADYAHWNEDADYMWWQEEGRHPEEPPEPDDDYRGPDEDPEDFCEDCGEYFEDCKCDDDEEQCSSCKSRAEQRYGVKR